MFLPYHRRHDGLSGNPLFPCLPMSAINHDKNTDKKGDLDPQKNIQVFHTVATAALAAFCPRVSVSAIKNDKNV